MAAWWPRDLGTYLLWQALGWSTIAALLAWSVLALGLPGWTAVIVVVVVVVTDVIMHAVTRRTSPVPLAHAVPPGTVGRVVGALQPVGCVLVEGELWRAAVGGGTPHQPAGARIVVRHVNGRTLMVEPLARVVDG
jgi:membrane protein implicated in regulation of membrane protease activity